MRPIRTRSIRTVVGTNASDSFSSLSIIANPKAVNPFTFSGFEARDLQSRGVGDLAIFEGASSGLLRDEDLETAAEAIEPGTGAVLLMYENRWAAPFVAAVRRNGGELIAAERVSAQDLMDALEAAEAAV